MCVKDLVILIHHIQRIFIFIISILVFCLTIQPLTSDMWSVRPQQKLFFFSSEHTACSALLFSVPSYLYHIRLFMFSSLSELFDAVCIVKFSLVEGCETAYHRLCDFFDLAAFICTMSECRNFEVGYAL
jgi:hypothetical protein